MKKIFTIAAREYWAMVATKAFVVSIVMMPVLMVGGLFATKFLNQAGGIKERKIVIWDGTGELFNTLKIQAAAHNLRVEAMANGNGEDDDLGFDSVEKFVLERANEKEMTDEIRSNVSSRIDKNEIYAFVEIPADLLTKMPKLDLSMSKKEMIDSIPSVDFRSHDSALSQARRWLESEMKNIIKSKRLEAEGIDIEKVKNAEASIRVKGLGLFKVGGDGEEEESNPLTTLFLPFGVMMLMFMVIFLAAQPSLESVLEEKSQKIAEVLLGSASTFQLMIGKLLGVVGGSLTIFSIYITGIIYLAMEQNYEIPFEILPWFVVFQVLGVFFYGALFMAVGASVSQLKEAQSMLLPVWMLMMSPMFVWFLIVRDPNSTVAVGMSLFPPATPTTLMLRMATGQTIPVWQPIIGLFLMIVSTLFVVHIAGRIFRVGILWQGKTPSIKEIFLWAFSNR